MRILPGILMVCAMVMTACATPAAPAATATLMPTMIPTPLPTATHIAVDLTPAQKAAVASVAQSLGAASQDITIKSTESVTWPDGCMGVRTIGLLCTKNQVPGFRIVVSAGGKDYEVHTNQDGSAVAPEQAVQAGGPAEQVAIRQLANNLGIPDIQVTVASSTLIEWPDSCLGVTQQGVMCAQVVTPGYLLVLDAAGNQFEYHTNQDASVIFPATLGLTWSQQGGIAGLCQNVDVYLSGEVFGLDCKPGGDGRMAVLTADQRSQLQQWADKFGSVSVDISDPKGVADGMTRQANLLGSGSGKPSKADERAIFDFGQKLYQGMYH